MSLLLFIANAVGDQVRISEFLAANDGQLADADGDFSDWIEIWNATEEAVDLEGWVLTDQEGDPRWRFPAATLGAGEHLLVWASGKDAVIGEEIHTDFRLSRSAGSYLGLLAPDGVTVVDEYRDYADQRTDVSYGYDAGKRFGYFKRPTPGSGNGGSIEGFVGDTGFSVDRGFHEEAFDLEITTSTEGARILYTLDGSTPKAGSLFVPDHGLVYDGPIRVESTTTVRAMALKERFEPTNVDTHTFLFIDDIAKQPKQPEGWPEDWGTNNEVPGRVAADYEMDPRVVENTLPGYSIRDALLDIPTLSIVMNQDDFIGSDGIYTKPQSRGPAYERPCSLELIYPDGEKGFQVDCGVEIHGNSSRRPWRMQKHSLRVSFKTQYGPGTLEYPFLKDSPITRFNKLILRACFTDSWGLVSWGASRYRPNDSQYIRDMWMKHSQRDMGHDFLNGNFMHLYVNGLYWGLFNPAEKMEAESLVTHLGGTEEDYDVIDDLVPPALDGSLAGWNTMHSLARKDLDDEANYRAIAEACDLANYADYMLLHFYADAEDWPHHNGHAMRNRGAGGPFKFYVWDQEIVLDNLRLGRRYDDARGGGALFQSLKKSREFRLLFADRAQKHLFNGGALTVKAAQDRYMALANRIDKAIVAESARWGDTQASTPYGNTINQPSNPNNVDDLAYPPAPNGPDFFFTREDSWVVERDNVVNNYLPAIHDLSSPFALINELKDEELWPNVSAPSFNQHGGEVPQGFLLKIMPDGAFASSDKVYYTIDGTDPRIFGGLPSATALRFDTDSDGVPLTETVTVKARFTKSNLFVPGGDWSPLIEATFRVGTFVEPSALQVSELMYHPGAPNEAERAAGFDSRSDFEFIEMVNTGSGKVDLASIRLTSGIEDPFAEAEKTELEPGEVILIVSNPEAMAMRYGTGLPIIGVFGDGRRLANGGEYLTLAKANGDPVWRFRYDDDEGWPAEADGDGHSLVVKGGPSAEIDLNLMTSWAASSVVGGTPGTLADGEPVEPEGFQTWREAMFGSDDAGNEAVSGVNADPDGDRLPNVFEFAWGLAPLEPSAAPYSVKPIGVDGSAMVEFRFPSSGDVTIAVERSIDLLQWTGEGISIFEEGDETVARLPSDQGVEAYLRLRGTLNP